MTLDAEIKDTLAEELDDIALELAMPCPVDATNCEATSVDTQLFQHIQAETERLGDTAEFYDFEELAHLAKWVLDNINVLKTQLTRLEQQHEKGQYYSWIELFATLLREANADAQTVLFTELNNELRQATWSITLDDALIQRLFARLSVAPLSDQFIASLSYTNKADKKVDEQLQTEQVDKEKESYHLKWDDDIHPELLEAFFLETPDLVTETAELIRLVSAGNADQAMHQKAARLAHTIKGSSAVVGIDAIANFAHKLEDILEYSAKSALPQAVTDCLIEAADCLEAMFDGLQTETTPPPEYPSLLVQLDGWNEKIKAGEVTPSMSLSQSETIDVGEEKEQNMPLSWDDDIHPELLAAYLSETPQHVQQLSQRLRNASKDDADNTQADYQQIAILAHTLKGSSATVGVHAFVEVAAILESIFDTAKEAVEFYSFSKAQCTLLNETAHLLENMHESLLSNKILPKTYSTLLEQLGVWQLQQEVSEEKPTKEREKVKVVRGTEEREERDDRETLVPLVSVTVSKAETKQVKEKKVNKQVSSREAKKVKKQPKKETAKAVTKVAAFKLPPMRAIQSVFIPPKVTKPVPQAFNLNEATLRVPISLIEKLLNFSNELITTNSQLADYTQALLNDKRTMHQRNERIRNLIDELEWAVSRQSILHTQQTHATTEFDSLEMDNYNALHGITNLLAETTNDERETSLALIKQFNRLKDHVVEQQKINKALNANILAMRMEPITLITPRLERIVRETCRQTGKKASFSMTGEDIALDTDVLKGLLDPLLHLLRNAVDHGIELPEIRQQNNKPPTGSIILHISQQGDQVLLTLKDDGAGIDAEAVYQQALKKDLIKADVLLTENEKLRLILRAGLSTRRKVSKVSGRGVGMDVVNTAIDDLSGHLHIRSKKMIGTEIQLHVPLTLVAVNVLLVKLSKRILAIPSAVIQQIYYLEEGTIQQHREQHVIHFDGNDIPLLSLSTLLNWSPTPFNNDVAQPIVIVKHDNQQYALYFDQVINFQEIVLKTLKPWMEKIQGVNGVCLLQNGIVAPVLNLAGLLVDIPQHAFHIQMVSSHNGSSTMMDNRRILVVDDSLSNRKALSLIIEPLGYEVLTAIDGEDAVRQLEKTAFGLVITDLEMPNMNGLQLSAYIRGNVAIQHYPIVMVTSRSTEKHRVLATKAGVNAYLTKPVNKSTLKAYIGKFIGSNSKKDSEKKSSVI